MPSGDRSQNCDKPVNGGNGYDVRTVTHYSVVYDPDYRKKVLGRWVYHVSHNGTCPADYTQNGSLCEPPIVPVCPSSGTSESKFEVIPKYDSNGLRIYNFNDTYSLNGCAIVRNTTAAYKCYDDPSKTILQCGALVTYEYTGEQAAEGQPSFNDDHPDLVDEPEVSSLQDGDYTEDKLDQIIGDSELTTLPDGSTVEIKTDVITETKGDGITIKTTTDKTIVTDTDGLIKSETTVTSITTNPDGSKQVQSVTSTSYQQTPINKVIYDSSSDSLTESETESLTGTQTTTTNQSYDSNGNLTGSSSSTENTGNGEGGEDQEDVSCEARPEGLNCIEFNPKGAIGNFDNGSIDAEIITELASLKTSIGSVRAEATELFEVELISSATPSCIPFITFGDVSREICLTDYDEGLAPIQALFLFLGLMIAAFIIFR